MNTRFLTKESRLQSRQYQFNKLIETGYIRETYKDLEFFTLNDGKYFTLKVFKGTGANHVEYVNYRTEERRAEVIKRYKDNYEMGLKWKAEQKEKNKGKSSSHAAAAAAIKEELKNNFPGIKFSVTSESFSMGDAVRISWTDGPTSKEVENFSSKYQYGHFDGMTDMYENSNDRDDIPQAKYVTESRKMSKELEEKLIPDAERLFIADHYSSVPNAQNFLYRIFSASSIPFGANVTGIEPTGETCGISTPETFYKIGYTLPESTIKKTEAPQIKEIEVKAGEIQIIEYGKGIAVIGDTKPIKDQLKALGGSFNPRLSCGAGWIFSKKRLDEVTKALTEETTQEPKQSATIEEAKQGIKEEVQKMIEFFAETDIKQCGEITESTKECARVQNVSLSAIEEETPQNYNSLKDIEEAAKGGKVISLYNLSQLVK